jgi:hypothetical protein
MDSVTSRSYTDGVDSEQSLGFEVITAGSASRSASVSSLHFGGGVSSRTDARDDSDGDTPRRVFPSDDRVSVALREAALLSSKGVRTPSASALLTDVSGLASDIAPFLLHVGLRLVDVPRGAAGFDTWHRVAGHGGSEGGVPNDFAVLNAGEVAAELFQAMPPGLVRVEWEMRARQCVEPLERALRLAGCHRVAQLAQFDLADLGACRATAAACPCFLRSRVS